MRSRGILLEYRVTIPHTLTLKKIIIFYYFTFHSFSPFFYKQKKNFHKQRETKNIPIQFHKKIPKKIFILLNLFISFLKRKRKIPFLLLPTIYTATKKVRNIYFSNSVSSSLPSPLSSPADLSVREKKGGREGLVNSKRACFARGTSESNGDFIFYGDAR